MLLRGLQKIKSSIPARMLRHDGLDASIIVIEKGVVFSTVDDNRGYWHEEIENKDQNKITFPSCHAPYEFNPLTFGVKNAPSTLELAIDSPKKEQTALVY